MRINEATWDRGARIAAGIVLLSLGWLDLVGGTWGVLFRWLGFVPLLTGLVGFCPAYSLFGLSTCPADPRARKAA